VNIVSILFIHDKEVAGSQHTGGQNTACRVGVKHPRGGLTVSIKVMIPTCSSGDVSLTSTHPGPRGKSFFSAGFSELADTRLGKEDYAAADHMLLIGCTW
jgi:hypothetical protein